LFIQNKKLTCLFYIIALFIAALATLTSYFNHQNKPALPAASERRRPVAPKSAKIRNVGARKQVSKTEAPTAQNVSSAKTPIPEPTSTAPEIECEKYEKYEEMTLPPGISGEFKTYMGYKAITNKQSKQWELQQSAMTDADGFRRYNGLYMIALGTYYSPEAGAEFEIEFDTGKKIRCVTGDVKDDRHTDPTRRYATDNNDIVEFIVDTRALDPTVKKMGDASYGGFEGAIAAIRRKVE
jgi:hypothetical protein